MGEEIKLGGKPDLPKRGDTYECEECGMTLVITVDCKCIVLNDECPVLDCCGEPMTKIL